MELSGKNAWVGGASKGLGKACAMALAKEGANVVLTARSKNQLQATIDQLRSQQLEATGVAADLGSAEQVHAAIKKCFRVYGPVDIAVVNSGGPKPGEFMSLSPEDWQRGYYGTLGYVIDICRLVLPQMKERKWGRIVVISSIVATEPAANLALSSVFRAGVLSLVKILSRDFAEFGVTVNSVSPGAFKTDRAVQLMKDRAVQTGESLEQIERDSVKRLPMRRFQTPEELGAVVAFLASDNSSAITGSDIRVDGGLSSRI